MCIDNYDFMFIRDNAYNKILQKIVLLSYNQWTNFETVNYKNNKDYLWIIKYQIFYHHVAAPT